MRVELLNKRVGELVVEQPGRSRIFERFSIDYCWGGKKTLANACKATGASPDAVVDALTDADHGELAGSESDWSSRSMGELIDHIVTKHHAYLRTELTRLSEMGEKVARVHGDRFDWLAECHRVFEAMRDELEQHMMKEEHVLFPMIKQIEVANTAPSFHCGNLQNPISVMEHEHDDAGQALSKMRALSGAFVPPVDACNTFRAWLHGLAELEADLHQHIHEENNILFPRAQAAESRLSVARAT
jgi:regulator of cell morphogenesis and NO signaling